METLVWILNNPLARLMLGVIMSGSIAAPFINGYTDQKGFLYFGATWMIAFVLSVITKFEFSVRRPWQLWALIISLVGLMAYLYFQWA